MKGLRAICPGQEFAASLAALALIFQAMMPLAAAGQQIKLDGQAGSPFAGGMVICTAFGLKVIDDPFDGTAPEGPSGEASAGNGHCVLSAAGGGYGLPPASALPGPGFVAVSNSAAAAAAAGRAPLSSFRSRAPPA